MRKIFSSRFLDSRITSSSTQTSEKVLGYFLGPCLVYTMYTGVAGTYLTQFYTDVLGLAGSFLTMMPLISKLFSSFVNILIGRMIDKTHTSQGQARPWLLISGPLLAVCGILLYTIPHVSYEGQLVWVIISYNLFFSLAFSIYSLSHSLMVPLSTRDSKKRDSLAMLTSTGTSMIPGMLTTLLMPFLIRSIGVGNHSQSSWITVMSILSILAIPATLIEYYFTKERIQKAPESEGSVSFKQQVSACFHDKYWVCVLAFTLILNLASTLSSQSMLYYCNWVLGNSIDSGASKQLLVNMIGQAPLGLGVVILWPLVRRFGKRTVTIIGFSIAALGSLTVLVAKNNMFIVLVGLSIRSIGALPTYVMAALLAEALDHVERKNGFRADGFSASANSIVLTVVQGISQTMLLVGINAYHYVAPDSSSQIIFQPWGMKHFFSLCFVGFPMIGYIICAIIMIVCRESSESTGY